MTGASSRASARVHTQRQIHGWARLQVNRSHYVTFAGMTSAAERLRRPEVSCISTEFMTRLFLNTEHKELWYLSISLSTKKGDFKAPEATSSATKGSNAVNDTDLSPQFQKYQTSPKKLQARLLKKKHDSFILKDYKNYKVMTIVQQFYKPDLNIVFCYWKCEDFFFHLYFCCLKLDCLPKC